MKSRILIILLFVFFFTALHAQNWLQMMQDSNANFYDIQKTFNKYWEGEKIEKGEGWKENNKLDENEGKMETFSIFRRWENFMAPRVYPSGKMNHASDLWKAYNELKKIKRF